MVCKICGSAVTVFSKAQILNRYEIDYFKCDNCDFIQTEEPFWLDEAYKNVVSLYDTGMLSRNITFCNLTSAVIFFFLKRHSQFLDYAGGYGIFTRLMRDGGFDFYWHDPYSPNLIARGFAFDIFKNTLQPEFELITCFEAFEHFGDPLKEVKKMLSHSRNILFSTCLLPQSYPKPTQWWYYGLEHGQHISFYSLKTLQILAKKLDSQIYSDGQFVHLLTDKKINKVLLRGIMKLSHCGLAPFLRRFMKSKTQEDYDFLIKEQNTLI